MLNLIFSMYSHMIFVSQHLIISFLIYPISPTMITVSNKSLTKLDLLYLTIHFHIKHLVSVQKKCSYSYSYRMIVFYLGLLHNYPSSIVAFSLIYNITSNTFISEQIKSFVLHKKDPKYYLVSQQISLSFIFSFFSLL